MEQSTPLKIVCAGDSITGWSDLTSYLKWSHILECMLEACLGRDHVQVVNRGIGGNTTGQLRERLQRDVLNENPDIVTVLIGGNDAGRQVSRRATEKNLNGILGALRQAGCRVLVMQYHLLVNDTNEDTAWTHLNTNNDLIAAAAEQHECPLLPLMPPMAEAWEQLSLAELVNPVDGVHLSPGGELVFARTIFKKLRQLGWI